MRPRSNESRGLKPRPEPQPATLSRSFRKTIAASDGRSPSPDDTLSDPATADTDAATRCLPRLPAGADLSQSLHQKTDHPDGLTSTPRLRVRGGREKWHPTHLLEPDIMNRLIDPSRAYGAVHPPDTAALPTKDLS